MNIHIKMLNGRSCTLKVNPQDTVGSLKMLIQKQLEVPAAGQKLTFTNGSSTPLNDDLKPLSFYNIEPGSLVSLLVIHQETFQVFLRNEKGVTSTYDVTSNETVENFKKRVEKRERIPANQQSLIHEGRAMESGKLSDYKVKEHSTIFLTLRLRGG